MAVLEGYLRKEQLAQDMGRSTRTLDRWETQRIGPPRVVIGRTVLYRVDAVREWLESQERRRGRRG